eukprot:5717895-Lingulodinium_polyedra.AAC.1
MLLRPPMGLHQTARTTTAQRRYRKNAKPKNNNRRNSLTGMPQRCGTCKVKRRPKRETHTAVPCCFAFVVDLGRMHPMWHALP